MDLVSFGPAILYPVALTTMMFSMGLTLKTEDFVRIMVKPKAVTLGLLGQLLFLPIIAFLMVITLPLPPEAAIGLIILSACPGGVVSNGIVYAVRADVALSITLTAVASVITVFTLPLIVSYGLVYVFGVSAELKLPLLDTMRQLFQVTVLPVSIGMAVHHYLPGFKKRIERFCRWATIILLVSMVTHGTVTNINLLADQIWLMVVASILLVCITMGLGYSCARYFSLNKNQGITISVELGVQNVAMSFFVAGTFLKRPDFTILPAIYGVCMFTVTAIFLRVMHKRKTL
jgi:BASS family bile acid:Na+ symporter